MKLFSIYDKTSETFSQPVFVRSPAEAIRSVKLEVNRAAEDNTLYRYPREFELWFVGDFNERDGVITGNPAFLVDCQSLREETKP